MISFYCPKPIAKEKDSGEGWGVHLVGELQALGVKMISGIGVKRVKL